MENAKKEFIEHVNGRPVLCASIENGRSYRDDRKQFVLPVGYSPDQYTAFLELLDFKYDSGYGGQELYGTIWYKDGTWSERGEYDGSEWWEYKKCPEIPKEIAIPGDAGNQQATAQG